MPAGAFEIGVSALLASQKQLATTSHNIANANTPGYSKQVVQLSQRPPQFVGDGFLGKGVDVTSISRQSSDFLNTQVLSSNWNAARAAKFTDLANQVDGIVGDGTFGTELQRFFSTLQDANNDPSSIPARQVFLAAAKSLTDGAQSIGSRLDVLNNDLNGDIRSTVKQLNAYSTALANVNHDIVQAYGVSQGAAPNDLLDQRDKILKDMSSIVNVSSIELPDHSMNVFIGNGQMIVSGSSSVPLAATANPLDGSQLEVSTTTGSTSSIISPAITSGSLAGIFQFRDQILNLARNSIGRLAAGIDFTVNAQHQAGLDLQGNQGGALFTLGSPNVNALPGSVSNVSVALDPTQFSQLTDSDYQLTYNGSNFDLKRLTDGVTQTLSGAGPFNVDGFTITVSGSPANGDQFLIQPTRFLGRGFGLATTDPRKVALASPVKSTTALTNTNDAKISTPTVLNSQNASLLTPTTMVFSSPPTTFQINGAGPLIPFTAGANIDVNGWRVQIIGTPAAGDSFQVTANTGSQGDNSNGLLLANLSTSQPLLGGTASYQDTYSQLVSGVGAQAQQAKISSDALQVQLNNAQAARDAVSGVNLDEEAADMLRFQQSFQAAAQIIQATNQTFQALIAAMR